ncbi:MAG: rhodanese-like domain-containing protein [Geobacteraceae bacterium]|nr:rhodanese-like domain-containing protein [Geobacteraceae bacterium]
MKVFYKKLFFEMTLIILLAIAIGITWNFRLLRAAYTGKPSAAPPSPTVSATPAAVLIPAGLAQVKELYDKKEAVFLDARDSSVFSRGHIQGATSLPLAELDSALPEFTAKVPYEKNLVIYCSGYGCHDSKDLGNKLLQKGYRQILIFEGGYPEWKDAGFPIKGAIQ